MVLFAWSEIWKQEVASLIFWIKRLENDFMSIPV